MKNFVFHGYRVFADLAQTFLLDVRFEGKHFLKTVIICLKLLDFHILSDFMQGKLVRTELEIICAPLLDFRYTVSVNEKPEF